MENTRTKTTRNSLILLLTAAIWGMAFVSQSKGMDYMHPFTFNGVRSLIGAASILVYILTESLRLGAGDIMVFLCAIAFAIQIMTVDHYAAGIDGAVVSCIQFTVCGVVCCIGALIWGQPTFGQLQEGLGALLYAGVLSCGVGYTLQIVGQKGLNPTVAALIMSLESVIATISGWIAYKIGFLTTDQTLTARQIAGCVIVFAAVILVQLPPEWFRFGKKNA